MTFAEKFQIDHPDIPAGDCLMFCPQIFCYEEKSICDMGCRECWDREMPEEEPHG